MPSMLEHYRAMSNFDEVKTRATSKKSVVSGLATDTPFYNQAVHPIGCAAFSNQTYPTSPTDIVTSKIPFSTSPSHKLTRIRLI